MNGLESFLTMKEERTIQTLAGYIRQYIDEQWQSVLEQNREELLRIFDNAGEGAAYGTYAQKLFRPVQQEMKGAGFLSEPSFPGTLTTSREWGPQEERERWMWSVVRRTQEGKEEEVELDGTLVIRFFHDHTRLRIPHPPEVLVIEETQDDAIVDAVDVFRRASPM